MDAIRHIAASIGEADLFGTAAFERTVSVWSFCQRKLLGQFDTLLDFGGRRLAISNCKRPIVAAASYSGGVCAYDAFTGSPIWRRPEIKTIQYLCAIANNKGQPFLGVGIDNGAFTLLESRSGRSCADLPGIEELYSSGVSGAALQVSSNKIAFCAKDCFYIDWQRTIAGSVLGVAMNCAAVTVSISAGSVLSFDFQGRLLWEWQPEEGHHVLSLCWSDRSCVWVGVYWCFESGGPNVLISLNERGELVSRKNIDTAEWPIGECEFFANGECLITSRGEVLTVPDLQVAWEFASVC